MNERFTDNGFKVVTLEEVEKIQKKVEEEQKKANSKDHNSGSSMSLISLTLIENENVHYHFDPETEFYNKCHSPEDGRFCSGPGAGVVSGRSSTRDSDGMPTEGIETPEKRGKLGASLKDPHEGTLTFDGVRGYDKVTKKPVPGTDAYLEAHNITRETWDARPYVKYEASKVDPALLTAFPKDKYKEGHKLFTRTAEDTDPPQKGGYIMYKHPVPGSPHGEIAPQIRPNVPVVTDRSERAKALTILQRSEAELENIKKTTPERLIKERRARVVQAKEDLARTMKATPESIKAEQREKLEAAKIKRDEVRATSTDPYEKKTAELEYAREKREHDKIVGTKNKKGKADRPSYKEGLVESKTLNVQYAEQRLKRTIEDPEGALDREIRRLGGRDGTGLRTKENQGGIVGRHRKAYEETAAKYLFTPGVSSARIDMGPDQQNVKNLTKKNGRIYFAMEGSIKSDALLASIKKEDPNATVVNVPSVTLWQQKNLTAELPQEIGWFSKTYAQDREVILIPDADGVKNHAVMLQAKALKSALLQNGAGQVYLATPPLKPGSTKDLDEFKLPSGHTEERKGIDDHLGGGRGTLGQLRYETFTDYPEYDLKWTTRGGGAKGPEKLSAGGRPRAEKILAAISGLVEDKGIGVIPLKTLNQTAGFKPSQRTSARSSMQKLEELGIIKVEYVFDPKAMGRGERIRNPKVSDERVDELVRMKVISEPRTDRRYTEVSMELSPVISILKPEYIIKSSARKTGALAEFDNWKPPSSFKGWTSAVTGKPDTTGIAKNQEYNLQRFIEKNAVKNGAGQTTKERLEKIKAPPGRRLVRTKAGAKRYGVSIGQPIPLPPRQVEQPVRPSPTTVASGEIVSMILLDSTASAEFDITSMVLLSSIMTEEELVEFYNQCHDEKGRFCETEGGSVSGKFGFGNKKIQTVGRAVVGSVEVDGVKAKAVYEIDTEDGQKIRLYDKAGNAGKYKDELLETQAEMHDLYPLDPPRNIVVTKPSSMFRDSEIDNDTFAIVHGDSPNVYINSEKLGIDVDQFKDGFQMPSAKTGDTRDMEYLLMHEYGHHLDFDKHSDGGYSYQTHPLYHNPTFRNSLSDYGSSDDKGIEAYAETFAEWNHSEGRTQNPAAIAMARYEGWPGPDELRGSGELSSVVVSLTLQDPIHLAKGSVKEFSGDTEDDINADVPKIGSKGITVIDSLKGTKVIGDLEIKEPSSEDITRADKIMREVYAELGLEYPGEKV